MANDTELEHLSTRLKAFAVSSEENHDTLQSLIHEHQKLLENHRQLKKAYEEIKVSRNKYKKAAKGKDPNPFVLVLVDGDSYHFKDKFMRDRGEGGDTAAQALSNSIKNVLVPKLGKGAGQYRVVVRIYANLAGLSQTMAQLGNAEDKMRSLAPFTSSFTRSQTLFDFIDAGDANDCVSSKIKAMFRLFADNSQCKHIIFAGCNDVAYLPLLTPYKGTQDRVTLIKGPSFIPVFETLELPIETLPSVFQYAEDETPPPLYPPKRPSAPPTNGSVCRFFQKGYCREGDECRRTHSIITEQSPALAVHQGPIAQLLPKGTPQNEGLIPINAKGERIDTCLPRPPMKAWEIYQQRTKVLKPCNRFHVVGGCNHLDCPFDHGPIEEESIEVMRFLMKEYTCPRGGKCRRAKCTNAHICQKENCTGSKPCKIKRSLHDVDPKVSEWVSPGDLQKEAEENHSNHSSDVEWIC